MNWLGAIQTLWFGLVASCACAVEPPPPVRRIYFPADQVDKLGDRFGELRAMSRDEFDSLLRRAQPSVADSLPQVDEARYQAKLVGNRLVGAAELKLQGSTDDATLLRWAASPIAISRARWGDEPAILGYAGHGELALATPAGADHVLTFDWSAAAQANSGGLRWLLRLPPSLRGELAIDLPRGWAVVAPTALVTPPSQAGETDSQRWSIQFRPTEPLALTLLRSTGPRPLDSLVLYENDIAVDLAPDGASIIANLSITVAHQPVRGLDVECAPDLKVFDWAGLDVSAWHEQDGKLHLELAEPLLGPAEITLRALGPRPAEGRWAAPRLALAGGFWTGGRTRLTPPAELNLYDVRADHGVVATTVDDDADVPAFVVEHRAVDAGVSARVSPRGPIVTCELHTRIEWAARVEATCSVEWGALDGETSEVRLRVPTGWSVDAVEPVQDGSLAQWSAEGRDGDVLRLRCARPVSVASPFTARIRLLGPSLETAASPLEMGIPRLTAPGSRVTHETLTIGESSTWSAELADSVGLHAIQSGGATYQFDRPDARARLVAKRHAAQLAAVLDSVITLDPRQVRAVHMIDVAPEGGPVDSVDVIFTGATGDSVEWQLPTGGRVERPEQAATASGTRDLWRITLPRGPTRRVRLLANWQTRLASTTAVPLPTVNHATSTDGRVRLSTHATLDAHAMVADLVPATDSAAGASPHTPDSDDPARREQLWTSAGPTPTLTLHCTPSPFVRPAAAYVNHATAQTTLSADGASLHRVRYEVRGQLRDDATLRLPTGAVVRRATAAGEPLALPSDEVVYIHAPIARPEWILDIEYSLAGPPLDIWAHREFRLPELSLPTLTSTWQLAAPLGYRPATWSSGGRAAHAVDQPAAMARLFGPLARIDRTGPFEFWKPSAWRRWWAGAPLGSSATASSHALAVDPIASNAGELNHPWRLDRAGEMRSVSVVVVDESFVRRGAWLVVIASLAIGLLARPRVGACATLSIVGVMGATVAPYPLNVPLAALGWSQFVLVAGRRLTSWWAAVNADGTRVAPSLAASAGIGGMILLWLFVTRTAQAQAPDVDKSSPAAWTVFLPYDPAAPEKWQAADRVLVPRATHEQLLAWSANRRGLNGQVLVRSAQYSGKIVGNRMEIVIDLDLENVGGAGARCTLPLTGLSIRSAQLDGQEALLQPEADGLTVRVREPGSRRMRIEAEVAIDTALSHGAIELGVPAAPAAHLTVEKPADFMLDLGPSVAHSDTAAGTLTAELGASDRIVMRWRRHAKPPAVRVDSAGVLNWTASAAWIEHRMVVHADPGPLDRIVLSHDSRLVPGVVRAPGLAGYWSEDAGPARRLIMEFDRPVDDQVRVAMVFFVRGPLGPKLTMPAIEVADAQARLRLLALRGDASAEIATAKADGVEPAFEDDFLGLWGEALPSASALRFVRLDASVRSLELERIAPTRRQPLEMAADLHIGPTRVDSITRFARDVRETVFAHELQLPAGMQVTQVQVSNGGRWRQVAEDRLLWFGESGPSKRMEVRVDGWVSRDAESVAIPVVRPVGDYELSGTIRNWRPRDVRLEFSDVMEIEQSSPVMDEDSPFGDRVLDSQFVVESLGFGATVNVVHSPADATSPPARDDPAQPGQPNLPAPQGSPPQPATLLERHHAQIRSDGAVAVSSELIVRSPASSEMRLAIPPTAQVLALTVNGRDVPPRDHASGGKVVFLPRHTRPHKLSVLWLWQPTTSGGDAAPIAIDLPRLTDASDPAVWTVSLPEGWQVARVAPAATTRTVAEQTASSAAADSSVATDGLAAGADSAESLTQWKSSEPTIYFVAHSGGPSLVLRPTQTWVGALASNGATLGGGFVVAAGVLLFGRRFRLAVPIALVLLGGLWCWSLQPEPVGPALLMLAIISAIVNLPRARESASPRPAIVHT
jgi:hypothetical protein